MNYLPDTALSDRLAVQLTTNCDYWTGSALALGFALCWTAIAADPYEDILDANALSRHRTCTW